MFDKIFYAVQIGFMLVEIRRSGCKMSLECQDGQKIPLQDLLCDLECAIIGKVLGLSGGIKAHTADKLMLNRTTLVEKSKKYGFPLRILGKKNV